MRKIKSKYIEASKEDLFIRTETHNLHFYIFYGNHLCQATKRHLNNSETVKNDERSDEKRKSLFSLLCCFPSSAWKNVESRNRTRTLICFFHLFASFINDPIKRQIKHTTEQPKNVTTKEPIKSANKRNTRKTSTSAANFYRTRRAHN